MTWTFSKKLHSFPATSKKSAFTQATKFFLHLICNTRVEPDQIDTFSRWILEQNQTALLKSILNIRLPTIHLFATKLLESAVRIGDAYFLRLLIDTGFDSAALTGPYGGRQLLMAIAVGHTEVARILIWHGADVNYFCCKEHPVSPLFSAISSCNIELVKLLLGAGAAIEASVGYFDEDEEYYYKQTALSIAIQVSDVNLIELLIQAGADVETCTIHNTAAIDWSEWHSSSEVYQSLCHASDRDNSRLEPGNIYSFTFGLFDHARDRDGYQIKYEDLLLAICEGQQFFSDYLKGRGIDVVSSARVQLERAFQNGAAGASSKNILRLLVAIGVDPNADLHSRWAKYPLESAVRFGDPGIVVDLLLAGADANKIPIILEEAVPSCDPGLLRLLLEYGVDIRNHGGRALWNATCSGNLEVVRMLLVAGADFNYRDSKGSTTLQHAACFFESVRLLIAAGADVNARASGEFGLTALQAAAEGGEIESVKQLINAGADINALPSNKCRFTALGGALRAAKNSMYLVKYLLSKGADVKTGKDGSDLQILQLAILGGNFEIMKLLLDAGANVNSSPCGENGESWQTPLQVAASIGSISALELLLGAGADVNAAASHLNGRTALQAAACAEETTMELIDVLLKAGADINAAAGYGGGVTALQGAAICGNIQIAAKFLEMGADVNAAPAEIYGRTAVEGAAEYGHLGMVQLLLKAGARTDLPNEKKFTKAIDLALKNDHFAVARLLEAHQ